MIFQLNLLTLLLSPVMAYLAAALIFSLVNRGSDDAAMPSLSNLEYRDGQH